MLGISISLSKITATLFFLENFPRKYPATEFHSLLSFVKTFFVTFFYKPNEKQFNENVESMFSFGIHEMEYNVSIIPIILLFFIPFLNKKVFKSNYYNIRFLFFVFIIFSIPIFLNVNLFGQFQLISKVPILNSTWVQFRWMAIYILPIIIISALIIKNLVSSNIKLKFNKKFPDGTPRKLLNSSKIRKLGWKPKIDVITGLKSTIEWYYKNYLVQ